jgi:hypothetical protein
MSNDELTNAEWADLARLVDGTLPSDRRAEVEARVAASPELTQMVADQGAAIDALRATAALGAPAGLRRRVSSASAPRRAPRRFMRPVLVGLAAAAVAIAIVAVLPHNGPSVGDTARIAQKRPTDPAPAAVPGTPQLLAVKVDDVPFPNYAAKFGWRAVGKREDRPSGRHATTIFYEKGGRQIAYTIVSGDALRTPTSAAVVKRGGVEYRTFRAADRNAVTWRRLGRTCVLSSRTVSKAELVTLADWRGTGAIPF